MLTLATTFGCSVPPYEANVHPAMALFADPMELDGAGYAGCSYDIEQAGAVVEAGWFDARGHLAGRDDGFVNGRPASHLDRRWHGDRLVAERGELLDSEGRWQEYRSSELAWSARGLLEERVDGAFTTRYAYDADGLRTRTTLEPGHLVTRWTWSGEEATAEGAQPELRRWDDDLRLVERRIGALTERYEWDGDALVALRADDDLTTLAVDGAGRRTEAVRDGVRATWTWDCP